MGDLGGARKRGSRTFRGQLDGQVSSLDWTLAGSVGARDISGGGTNRTAKAWS